MRSIWVVVGMMGFSMMTWNGNAQDHAAKPEFYTTNIKPILEANCGKCHMGANHRGGLSLETQESLLQGGHHGPAVVPGDPAGSLLLKLIRREGTGEDPMPMPPPPREKLSDANIATIEHWIEAGALMPVAVAKP